VTVILLPPHRKHFLVASHAAAGAKPIIISLKPSTDNSAFVGVLHQQITAIEACLKKSNLQITVIRGRKACYFPR